MIRKRASERIEYLDPGGDESRVLFDLSKGGACCLAKTKLDKGAFVRITLDDLMVRAKITYSIERTDGYRVGMQFWRVSAEQQRAIDALVERFSRGVPIRCLLAVDERTESASSSSDAGEQASA
ncbi:MAG: hypothetical protein GF331_17210 [Chitinivibrionales bacterium]|nr:hypothetical protein [Chitinivibrionales bacterium]